MFINYFRISFCGTYFCESTAKKLSFVRFVFANQVQIKTLAEFIIANQLNINIFAWLYFATENLFWKKYCKQKQ